LLNTITNPTPAVGEDFGIAVAALGSDRVLIGAFLAYNGPLIAGEAYLFDLNGTLLTTFTNPTPASYDYFGYSVAAVGTSCVLIGAYADHAGSGAAYLFSTNGALLTTFTNPATASAALFGYAVSGMGNARVLIGAPHDSTGATNAGVAYLFGTNGALLTTFTNPAPSTNNAFGGEVAAVGNDWVLIGAIRNDIGASNAGAAYLFSTNGALITTFTNPAPAIDDQLGWSVAALGSDRVLIGAPYHDAGATKAGVAYLFGTNGVLLATFTNPIPSQNALFGYPVAALGNDVVLIGASGADLLAGAAYLFGTNGNLLTTFSDPEPGRSNANDSFGFAVTAIGNDRVLIGAPFDNTGASSAGVAYLFRIAPSLNIRRTTTNTVAVSWSLPLPGLTLQQNTNGLATANWSNVTDAIQEDGTTKTLIVNPPAGNRFYRLFKP
jgi:hypothetical protein